MKPAKTTVVGIDIGYGFTKVYADKVSNIFPSMVSRMQARGAFGSQENYMMVNGQKYIVGDDITTFGNHSVSTEFVGTPEYVALLGQALTTVKNPCNILVLGLPPGLYDETRIAALERTISMASISSTSGPVKMPKTIKFVPQGVGIYFDYINSINQKNKLSQGNIIVIDIGYFTMDFVLISKHRYIAGAARSYPLGISKLLNEIKIHFTKVHGVFMNNDDNILKIIRDGEITHVGKTYKLNVTAQMEEYINNKVLKAVGEYAAELRESANNSVDQIIIGGGGVNCIGQFAGNALIVESPQMSNARGYYQYGLQLAGESNSVTNTKETNDTPQEYASA